MFRSSLRFSAGALAGIALWLFAGSLYNSVLATASQPLLRIDARLRNAEIFANRSVIVGRAAERGVYVPHVVIPASELTYNIILLLALFAMNRPNPVVLAFALLILFLTHIVAVVVTLEATYATRTGAWGEEHYSAMARSFWAGAEWAYRLAGMFAVAFGMWWFTRDRAE